LAHIRVWSRALSPSDVYRNSVPSYVPVAADGPLWLYYKLDNLASITNSAPSGPAVSGAVTGTITATNQTPMSPNRCGLTWDAMGNAISDGLLTAKGGLMILADSGPADRTLYLRSKPNNPTTTPPTIGWDPNHGLGYYGLIPGTSGNP